MITLRDISKSYNLGKRLLTVLHDINLHVDKGELIAIMGPSGSGKSTMLNVLGCLDLPSTGQYLLDGREVSKLTSGDLSRVRAHKIGFIFQQFNLLPRISALANVELGLRYAGMSDRRLAEDALAMVGLSERKNHKPTEMSGGEQQRVAIARALAKKPPLVLADEPTGNLDSKSGKEIMAILTGLHAEQHITLVMITHDPGVARNCQRVIHLKDGGIESEEKL
jgi:putative ABC transport system ATP-binding protein